MTYDSIQKTASCQEDDYTTGCFLDYNYLFSLMKKQKEAVSDFPQGTKKIL